jgi:hypothetical protein
VDATVTIPRRFCGPDDCGNGGYTAGRVAQYLGGAVEVTLRRPPRLERPLRVEREPDRVTLWDGAELVADATATTLDFDLVPPVPVEGAVEASRAVPDRYLARHPFPRCFVCGPAREPGDGMRLFAGRVGGTDHFAVPWVPDEVDEVLVWAALDCPSSAVLHLDDDDPPPHVLGRFAARIDHLPEPGAPHVIMSWRLGRDGRKVFSASALYDADARLLAMAGATWIRLLAPR